MLGLPARRFVHVGLFALFVLLLLLPGRARADQPSGHTVGVAILAFDSDDAEDQAEAITTALRSRVVNAQGWSIIETNQSLGTLTAAFKCPARPTLDCQQKIADQIKADRFIFGFVTKGPQAGQVTAEVHLFQRGKLEAQPVREQFSDNLRDGHDDSLRKIASHIMDRLGGTVIGVVNVHSPEQAGDVIIDGEKHVPLDKGMARLELAPGAHAIELAAASGASSKSLINVTAGGNVTIELSRVATPGGPAQDQKSNTRKIIGGAVAGAGVVLGVVAIIELAHFLSLHSDGADEAATLNKNDPQNGSKQCKEYDSRCAQIDSDSKTASTLAWTFGAAGAVAIGVGAYLFFSDPGEKSSSSALNKTRIVPSVAPGSGSLTVLGRF